MKDFVKISKKGYLMTAGALLPATLGIVAVSLITKQPMKLNKTSIAVGVAGLIIGGMFTAKLLKDSKSFE